MGLGCMEEDWGRISGVGFKKCLTNELDGTEDDLMRQF
jgi:hypothetical protein